MYILASKTISKNNLRCKVNENELKLLAEIHSYKNKAASNPDQNLMLLYWLAAT
jgi:hypothetical protein